MSFDAPWLLCLLPLAALPFVAALGPLGSADTAPLANAWISLLPRDRASDALGFALRMLAALTIALLVAGSAGPYRPEYPVQRIGRGAEIELLLDRSRSMDQRFAGSRAAGPAPSGTGPEAIDYYLRLRNAADRESKGQAARRLLAEFTASRPQDRFGLVVFSGIALPVIDFTQKQAVIQAAIRAADVGRGLSETDLGGALVKALHAFDERPYTGSRIVLLVSDGGDHIDPDVRREIAALVRQLRISIYWIYLRSAASPGLLLDADGANGAKPTDATLADASPASVDPDTVPEYFLHRFFGSLGTRYRAFQAENPDDLKRAIAEVGRLENLPIHYVDTIPRRGLAPWFDATALAGVLGLLAASLFEIRRWA